MIRSTKKKQSALQTASKKISSFILQLIKAFIDVIRLGLGPMGTCIYPITCRQYAYAQLATTPWYKAIPRIIFRVLSCNPITVLWWKIKKKLLV